MAVLSSVPMPDLAPLPDASTTHWPVLALAGIAIVAGVVFAAILARSFWPRAWKVSDRLAGAWMIAGGVMLAAIIAAALLDGWLDDRARQASLDVSAEREAVHAATLAALEEAYGVAIDTERLRMLDEGWSSQPVEVTFPDGHAEDCEVLREADSLVLTCPSDPS